MFKNRLTSTGWAALDEIHKLPWKHNRNMDKNKRIKCILMSGIQGTLKSAFYPEPVIPFTWLYLNTGSLAAFCNNVKQHDPYSNHSAHTAVSHSEHKLENMEDIAVVFASNTKVCTVLYFIYREREREQQGMQLLLNYTFLCNQITDFPLMYFSFFIMSIWHIAFKEKI